MIARTEQHTTWGIRDHAARLKRRTDEARIRVLVVDDEPGVLRLVSRILDEAGYDTVSASSGDEALTIVATQEPFDLLLTDLMMPQMNGDELARRLTYRDPTLKVLYLTGYSDRLFEEKVTLWEGEAFLDKPPTVSGLIEAVSMVLFNHPIPDGPEPSGWSALTARVRSLLSLH